MTRRAHAGFWAASLALVAGAAWASPGARASVADAGDVLALAARLTRAELTTEQIAALFGPVSARRDGPAADAFVLTIGEPAPAFTTVTVEQRPRPAPPSGGLVVTIDVVFAETARPARARVSRLCRLRPGADGEVCDLGKKGDPHQVTLVVVSDADPARVRAIRVVRRPRWP